MITVKTLVKGGVTIFVMLLLSSCESEIDKNAICKNSEVDTPYCRYQGTIKKLYANSDGLGLIVIDGIFSIEDAKKYGYEIKTGHMIAYSLKGDDKISTEMLGLIKLAFTEGFSIEIHARKVFKGYLTVDRVWVEAK